MLFQALRCKDCGRLMTKTQMEFQKCKCGGVDGEPVEMDELSFEEHEQFLRGELYLLCDHEFLRCNRPLCDKLMLTTDIKSGGCPCGSVKVRGINLNGAFTPEEWALIKEGKAHSYDPNAVSIDPDVLNKDNKDYWDRVKSEVTPNEFRRRWEVANAQG